MTTNHVVITGANRGIGLELARLAVARGDSVTAGCRRPAQADALQALATSHANLEIRAVTVDDADSLAAFTAALDGRRVDVLINNAAIVGPPAEQQSAFTMDYDSWAETFAVNSIAPVRVLHALRGNLEKSNLAKAVSVSSQMGAISVDMAFTLAYCASKAALNKVMRLMAPEFAELGIVISLVHPGWVRTDMGGDDADIAPEESAAGLWSVIDKLTLADAGSFYSWTGERHPW